MNIFLYAFVDNNFGDMLFVHTLVKRYPEHKFYMQIRNGYEEAYHLLKNHEKNIYLVENDEDYAFLEEMNAMLVVGGDLFWDYGDYSGFFEMMRIIKKNNGWTAILGISLFEKYSEKTNEDLKEMFSLTDLIVVRDKESFLQTKKLVPDNKVVLSTDMAFKVDLKQAKKIEIHKGVLGISVRKKIPRNTEDKYVEYCSGIADTAVAYLNESEHNTISFLALSSGNCNDNLVVDEIMNLCPEEYRSRMKCVPFEGNVEEYILEIAKCEKLLCTRFHALVFAISLKKPFVPIIYEEKMRRLLKEIAYYGLAPMYENVLNPEEIICAFQKQHYLESELKWYSDKAEVFFEEIDEWFGLPEDKGKLGKFISKKISLILEKRK